jgi:hypothetical protein
VHPDLNLAIASPLSDRDKQCSDRYIICLLSKALLIHQIPAHQIQIHQIPALQLFQIE